MKIALISSEYPPSGAGIAQYVEKLAFGLIERGHSVEILTRGSAGSSKREIVSNKLTVRRLRFLPIFPLGNLMLGMQIEKMALESRLNVDIINLHSPAPIRVASSVPLILTIHNVLAANTEELRRGKGIPSAARMASPVLSFFEGACIRNSSKLVAVSESVARQIQDSHGISNGLIEVVGNGVDIERFSPSHAIPKSNYILYTGRLHRSKRIDILIRAFSEITKDLPGVNLLIVGRGPEERTLRRQATKLDIGHKVIFTGWLTGDAYRDVVRNAQTYVLPSPYEGMSTSLLEAMASGVAAVATDIPNNSEIIRNETDGLLFRNGDHGDLAAKILLLYQDELLRAKIERNAREVCTSNYDWKGVADKYARMFQSTISPCKSGFVEDGPTRTIGSRR